MKSLKNINTNHIEKVIIEVSQKDCILDRLNIKNIMLVIVYKIKIWNVNKIA